MTITRGRGLVLTVCNNSEVPTFTKDFQTADELGIYRNRSLIKLQGTESEASKPTYKDNVGAANLLALAALVLSYLPMT
jgi:hypothetical protein